MTTTGVGGVRGGAAEVDRDEVDQRLGAWLERLDALTYYEIFGVPRDASEAEVRDAFHAFCDAFHPDRHRDAPPDRQEAVTTIFRRGTEAIGVLTDRALREQYDLELSIVREVYAPARRASASPHSRSPSAVSLEERVRVPSARPFAARAEELMRAGDYRQAKLHLVLANHRDPENPALEEALRKLDATLAASK